MGPRSAVVGAGNAYSWLHGTFGGATSRTTKHCIWRRNRMRVPPLGPFCGAFYEATRHCTGRRHSMR
eukprot:9208261-Pyramimonas_sp.AAC.1